VSGGVIRDKILGKIRGIVTPIAVLRRCQEGSQWGKEVEGGPARRGEKEELKTGITR